MGKIYFVRHGESVGNVWEDAYKDDSCNFLSPYGVKQAELCGEYFYRRGIKFDRIVSSDKTRARHTTSVILQQMQDWQRAWEVDAGFNELENPLYASEMLLAFNNLFANWDKQGNLLLVSHYYVQQKIMYHLDVNLEDIYGHGRVYLNAVPYVWDTNEPEKIKQLDLFSPRYQIKDK